MRRTLFTLLCTSLFLVACVDTTGISEESSRPPKGNANAAVTVVEFGDLQCPACKAAHAQIVQPLIEQRGSQIRFEFHHFPLQSIHRYALQAAMAAECAADQGKFWEFVDLDYADQAKLDNDQLYRWADALGLDDDLFDRCLRSKIKRKAVLADYDQGQELGVSGTPTFFVNGKKVESGLPQITAAIDAAFAEVRGGL